MEDLGQLFSGYIIRGEESAHLLFYHNHMFRHHRMMEYIQLYRQLENPRIIKTFTFRRITNEKPIGYPITGPEGFEPPTTWLKARRSAELSYEPTGILIA
jgi:hypothetical protein